MRAVLVTMVWAIGWLPVVAADLDTVYPVAFRGDRLGVALKELADKLGVAYTLDESVEAAVLETPIRMSARHLTGREVFEWLARLGELEVVADTGKKFVIKKGDLGEMGQGVSVALVLDQTNEDPRLVASRGVRVPIEWTDAPLSRVIQDISTHFKLDLIVHAAVQDRQPLVFFNQGKASLAEVVVCLQDQLKSRVTYTCGALWLFPEEAERKVLTASRPSDSVREKVSGPTINRDRPTPLEQTIRIDEGIRSWSELSDFLNKLDGLSCRMEGSPVISYPPVRAAGTVADVLDGLRLLNFVDWRYSANGATAGGIIDMEIRSRD